MSGSGDTPHRHEQLPRLRRRPRPAGSVAPSSFEVEHSDIWIAYRPAQRRWMIIGGVSDQSQQWLRDSGLDHKTFARRRDAARTIAAYAAEHPLPEHHERQTPLIRVQAGAHRSADGRWDVRRSSRPAGWYVTRVGVSTRWVGTLREARALIAWLDRYAA